jgi:hypothetical protein
MWRNFRKLNELDFRKEYQIKISHRSVDLENLCDSEDINRAWENIKDNIKTSAKKNLCLYESKQH